MTRAFTREPVWTWKCDRCLRESHLARQQSGSLGLPTPAEMRAAGWFIADIYGDLCPLCAAKEATPK